jgi:hypothetical protein
VRTSWFSSSISGTGKNCTGLRLNNTWGRGVSDKGASEVARKLPRTMAGGCRLVEKWEETKEETGESGGRGGTSKVVQG